MNINKSGTRKEELLLTKEEINRVYLLRNFLGDMPPDESIVFLLKQLARTKNNKEFFVQMAQGDRIGGCPQSQVPKPSVPIRILAIDYGDRRVGLAVSDPSGTIASPAGFIERRRGKRPPIAGMIRRGTELEVQAFVVGLPLDGGNDTPRALEARHVAAELEKRTGLPVRLVDERFTTAAALRAIRDMGGSTRGRKGDVDSMAATILLQHALSLPR